MKNGDKIVAKTTTDGKGDFELSFTPANQNSFDFYACGVGRDTLLLESVDTFDSDTPELTFYLPSKPKKTALGKVICPKCKNADKVYKVVTSFAPKVTVTINNNGDTLYSPLYKDTYQVSCVSGGAQYYCDRDKVKF